MFSGKTHKDSDRAPDAHSKRATCADLLRHSSHEVTSRFYDSMASRVPESPGDRILAGATSATIKIELYRDDDGPGECTCDIALTSMIDGDNAATAELLAGLIQHFQTPRTEGGAQ